MATGLSLHLYTTKQELDNSKNGVSTIVAWIKGKQPKEAIFHVGASVDICDVLDSGEVRINVSKTDGEMEKAAALMGAVMGAELEKVFSKL
ncbi:hypothetical protein [Desulfosporosinus sp. OT]|uniref:hypothetical protein n=1 Tax=Desulfosporosinus sp. OT TaxID=913865 RepID=UPI0002239F89|nr:hypothetical protein [Desulfosporosinus sp. OT]EGW40688.1 hypothetical protein DOT_1311 [Desulfosporosinus sp. OT]